MTGLEVFLLDTRGPTRRSHPILRSTTVEDPLCPDGPNSIVSSFRPVADTKLIFGSHPFSFVFACISLVLQKKMSRRFHNLFPFLWVSLYNVCNTIVVLVL